MKKSLLFSFTLISLISCSEDRTILNQPSLSSETSSSLPTNRNELILDSISRMNAGAFVESKLTPRIIDSLKKIDTHIITSSTGIRSVMALGDEYTDGSGKIHLKIFTREAIPAQHPVVECPVDPGWVLVGGGVMDQYGQSFAHPEASYLTINRPLDDMSAWLGASKDHYYPNSHGMTVYAIGMKLDSVDPAYLKSKIHLHIQSGARANHPFASADIGANEYLIGGGAYDQYATYGNMLVTSYPQSATTWYAEGKDQHWADPGIISAYVIGIENINFPNFGYLETAFFHSLEGTQYPVTTTVTSGWGLTCSAGYVTYSLYGILMTDCYPNSNIESYLWAIPCVYVSYGHQTAYAIGIRKIE
jgi:hypothetical protein